MELWSTTIMRSMITVACWLETLGCWRTIDARVGSRPRTICPGGAASRPVVISERVIAGWCSGMGTCAAPSVNCVRRSKGACSPGLKLPAVGEGDPLAADEDELAAAEVDDPRVLGHHAVPREHDVPAGQAADGEVLLAEARDHAELFNTCGEREQPRRVDPMRGRLAAGRAAQSLRGWRRRSISCCTAEERDRWR